MPVCEIINESLRENSKTYTVHILVIHLLSLKGKYLIRYQIAHSAPSPKSQVFLVHQSSIILRIVSKLIYGTVSKR